MLLGGRPLKAYAREMKFLLNGDAKCETVSLKVTVIFNLVKLFSTEIKLVFSKFGLF